MLAPALVTAENLDATVANMRFIKPLDVELIKTLAATHDLLVTVEENCVMGGAGSAVAEALEAEGIVKKLLLLGLPDRFIEHGSPEGLLAACGLDAAGIKTAIERKLSE
jgi:1-deoxy-D-xylulose-5-phosphate synthase